MKDVIIIGTGKAGYLHYYSYKKLKKIGKIYFVDIDGTIKNHNITVTKAYTTIESVISENNLDKSNVIVDICTPKSVFLDIVNECKKIGITDIIVEKPFIVEQDFFEKNKELDIAMIRNYAYSKIITEIKRIITEKKLKPKMIYTNFSKNRTEESFNGRGMFKKTTRNIEHDIPHQVYFTQYILENTNSTRLMLQEEKDMIKGEKALRKHGYSKIISKKDDVLVIHESDFASNTKIREVIVVCDDDTTIRGEFLFYDNDLNKLKDGNVSVLKNNKPIYIENIDYDDNMYECILDIYTYFNQENRNDKFKNEILDFSKEMNIYMNS